MAGYSIMQHKIQDNRKKARNIKEKNNKSVKKSIKVLDIINLR